MTELLSLTDSYVKEFKAVVTAENLENHGIVLDQTAFYPGGGGQPSDRGKLYTEFSSYQINTIKRIDGEYVHIIEGNENQAGVGGLGLLTSSYISAKYGGLGESILGPTVGGALEWLQAARNGEFLKEFSREPIVTAMKSILMLGIITEDFVDDYLRADNSTSVPVEPASIEELR